MCGFQERFFRSCVEKLRFTVGYWNLLSDSFYTMKLMHSSFQWTCISSSSAIFSRVVSAAFIVQFAPGAEVRPFIWQRQWCCAGCDPHTCGLVNLGRQERSEDSWAQAAAPKGREKFASPLYQILLLCKDLTPLGTCLSVKCSQQYMTGSKIQRGRDRSDTHWRAGNVITFISSGNQICKSYAKLWIVCW